MRSAIVGCILSVMSCATVTAAPKPYYWNAIGLYADGTASDSVSITPQKSVESYFALRRSNGVGRVVHFSRLEIDVEGLVADICASGVSQRGADNRRYRGQAIATGVKSGDIVPMFDELYRVSVSKRQVTLNLVTQDINEAFRPAPGSMTIALGTKGAIVFKNKAARGEIGRVDVDKIEDEKGDAGVVAKAMLTIYPPLDKPRSQDPKQAIPKTIQVKLGKGELLATKYEQFLITRVVPPQKTDAGQLMGWMRYNRKLWSMSG